MIGNKKGSSAYRKVIGSKRKKDDIHNPTRWRKKLEDETITSLQVRLAMKLIHSKYLDPDTRDTLCRFYHSKTMFGANLLAAGLTDDSWCKSCLRESDPNNPCEVVERVLHASYDCPSVMRVRLQVMHELDLLDNNIPTNPGSVVLATVISNTKDDRNLSELINIVWALTLNGILKARNAQKTVRADLVIKEIKLALTHILRVKPNSSLSIIIRDRNMEPLLARAYTPHMIGNGLD